MFNKEEISLCKQVAVKHRKKLTHGDWFYDEKSKTVHLFQRNKTRVERKILTLIHPTGELPDIRCFHWFPLWTISDCLEFLRGKGFVHLLFYEDGAQCLIRQDRWGKYISDKEGRTPLEACLKAVLAVLEEGKCTK